MIRFMFSPYGRISRKTYWLSWILPYLGIMIVATIMDFAFFPLHPVRQEPPPVFQGLVSLILFWPSIAVTTKRLHDRGMTGWWNLAPFAAVVMVATASYSYYSAQMSGGRGPEPILILAFFAVAAWLFLYPAVNTLFLRGNQGANAYGQDPLAPADPAAEFA